MALQSQYEPLYSMSPNQTSACPQCSRSSDFCFLCEYASLDNANDAVNNIKTLGQELAREKKEISTIAAAMVEAYDESVRSELEWKSKNGTIVQAPQWTKAAASRHIMFSTEFQAFDNAVEQIFHTLIYNLNSRAVESSTGNVCEDTRKALVDSISKYSSWKTAQLSREQNAKGGMSVAQKRKMSDGN